ncbi:dienelactone hydrolase family protein [Paremcibacter congregatus]|uniref:dienelactone hydrolase family protein n=1 Tax=Paremcibacter congregatus TaxID=2043170 RepID=UPI000DF258CB|nr:alpha/beta hydrolase [Paremcibacter congregatus]QDE26751.1 alpha/beta hydrolase [Paremcibacter congregatus]
MSVPDTPTNLLPIRDKNVQIPLKYITLYGRLTVPKDAHGLVIFAHGSGSSRHSSRNWYVAEILHDQKIATLLIDLLTDKEEQIDLRTRHLRFDIPLLADRLVEIASWAKNEPITQHLKLGYFGSSTGGGAALIAAARKTVPISAVVSRGGRPDLAREYLSQVDAPTLLIVGEKDLTVLELNRDALSKLNKHSRLHIIPGATHLFEEPGTLKLAAHEAMKWFKLYLG